MKNYDTMERKEIFTMPDQTKRVPYDECPVYIAHLDEKTPGVLPEEPVEEGAESQ